MKTKKGKYVVAVVGSSGAVGTEMIRTLEKRRFPVDRLIPLASSRSAGKMITFRRKQIPTEELATFDWKGVDIALFSAGGSISAKYAPKAVSGGAIVVDNTSHFRTDPDIPLVVPEVNPGALKKHQGIIANPNCSTIQMVMALKPLHDKFQIKRVVVSTYQSVSGAGQKSINALLNESMKRLSKTKIKNYVMGKQIAFNLIPQIDVFMEDGSTKEEWKMVQETKKILEDDSLLVAATCVRVPVLRAHSESVNVEFHKPAPLASVRRCLKQFPGVVVQDDPKKLEYPTPVAAENKYDTYVGRIRLDPTVKHGIQLWIVSDNLLKGAALNSVQIAEALIA